MTREDIKTITDIVHKTIYGFFDVCGDDEETPMTDKDKLLLKINKAICNNIKALEQEPCVVNIKKLSDDEIKKFEEAMKKATVQVFPKEPCEDWHDVSSDEMTLEQARQAVKDLREKLAEHFGDTVNLQSFKQVMWERDIAIEQLKELGYGFGQKIEPSGDLISRQSVDTLVDELARAISDERCCISRGRSTATIMQDILDLPSVNLQEPKWIPVSERLPEDRRAVLVTAYWHETYQVMMASYYGDGLWWCVPFNNCGEHMQRLNPKAWMPLPEPYEPQESEDKG